METPRFKHALAQHKAEMDDATYWRYNSGRLPRLLIWLMQRPELAAALAADAAALASSKDATKGGDVASASAI